MTKTNKLKGRMVELGYNISSLSIAMSLSRTSLRSKINGTTDFKVSEIKKMCTMLEIPLSDVGIYFFGECVPNKETQANNENTVRKMS